MLKIQSLNASVGDKSIIKSLNLSIQPGEVHAIMGPNGSGKSTLSNVITGHPDYQVTAGDIHYDGEDLLEMEIPARSIWQKLWKIGPISHLIGWIKNCLISLRRKKLRKLKSFLKLRTQLY